MPRRRLLTEKQHVNLLALSTDDVILAQHYALSDADKTVIGKLGVVTASQHALLWLANGQFGSVKAIVIA